MLTAVGIAVLAFASTNVDGMLVLVGFLADPGYRLRTVVLGECMGVGVLVLASLVCAHLAVAIPGKYIGLLGFAPVVIGLAKLPSALRDQAGRDQAGRDQAGRDQAGGAAAQQGSRAGGSRVLAVSGVTIANGGDNIGTYVPLFATSTTAHLLATLAVFAAMTALWCVLAHLLVRHRAVGALVRRWGGRALPFVLVALGFYILWQSGSVALAGQWGAAS